MKTAKALKRILIVDDHPIVRKGLAQLIEEQEDLTVCDEAEDAVSAMDHIRRNLPDLALVDISLKGVSGVELIEDIRKCFPGLPVLVISMHDESLYAERAFRAGAKGYIMKQEDDEVLVEAIHRVLSGGVWISERMTEALVSQIAHPGRDDDQSPTSILTNRELEVFGLIGQGYETRQIADSLCRSIKTIETYRARIKRKLNLKSNAQLVQRAVEWAITEGQK